MAYRLGVDIGGTFTDAILVEAAGGAVFRSKVPSTPADPAAAFVRALEQTLVQARAGRDEVSLIVHATTVATNAIIEGEVARTAFVTTQGFQDMLEIARQTRPTLYDLLFEKPKPLVPRHLSFGVRERIDAQGHVLCALDETDLGRVAQALVREGVAAVAVCFLHSYVDGAHERRAAQILRQRLPDTPISLSSVIAPEFREYLRASTTVINASVQPVAAAYLRRVEESLRGRGVAATVLLMQSNGGVTTLPAARERPVSIVESGPAAGVVAAAYLGQSLGCPDLVSLDMGGTTAKAGLVRGGCPQVTKEYEVGATAHAGVGGMRGRGYPIRTPVIDLVEIGAGGGSIAWVDTGGALRVGPRSAGARPGPACYGLGGVEPTVTDANLVLGRLSAQYFLGGELQLAADAAWAAIERRCARPLNMPVIEAALGIVEIANAAMSNALRLISIRRGHDPRQFPLVAFGGAGPLHALAVAKEVGFAGAIIPPSPGTFSALGLLVSDLRHELSRSLLVRLDAVRPTAVEAALAALERAGAAQLRADGVSAADAATQRSAEVRYVGQSYELEVALPRGRCDEKALDALAAAFHRAHERAYGFSAPDEPVELVSVRVVALGRMRKPTVSDARSGLAPSGPGLPAAPKEVRPVYFSATRRLELCPVYARYALPSGSEIEGPAIIEEVDSTTLVPPNARARVDTLGNLRLEDFGASEGQVAAK